MVRIVQEKTQRPQSAKPEELPEQLGYKHQVLLNVLGLVVVDTPDRVQKLLEDYSIELSREPSEEELADLLLLAIGERDADFNRDLASLILDRTLDSSYDQFDFKQLGGQAVDVLSSMGKNQNAQGQNQPGILSGLTSTIGQIGGMIGQGIQATRSRSSASQHTRQGMAAYRQQQAEQQETQQKRKNNIILVMLLTILGIGMLGLIAQIKRQAQPNIKTS